MRWLFNVIKGNLINTNVKSVVIPNDIKSETKEEKKIVKKEFAPFDESEKESEKLFFEQEEDFEEPSEEEKNSLDILEEILVEKRNELEKIQKEAIEKINEAEAKAREIIENARILAEQESNDIKATAWEEGFSRGRQEAVENMENDIDATFLNANNILMEASHKAREIFMNNREAMIKLSFMMAEKIIKKELKDKEVLFNNLMEAMKKAQNNKELKIFVNWEQLTYGKELKEKLQNSFQGIEKIEIIEDRTVTQGGCIIETKLGKIDATIESQLDILINALYEE